MNEKNFDSISKFEVPKSWIDDALNVPQNHVKKPLPLIKFSRTIMAVACFILVCGISVALYFVTDDSSIPPVRTLDSSQSINAETTKKDSGINESENKESINQGDSASQSPSTPNSHPERSEDEIQDSTDALKKPDKNPDKKPSDKPNKNPIEDNQEKPVQTDAPENPIETPTEDEDKKPEDQKPTAPVEHPSEEDEPPYIPEGPTEVPVTEAPLYPSEAPPSVSPTENATITPTEAPCTEAPIYPTQPPATDCDDTKIIAETGSESFTTSDCMYCMILSPDGAILGTHTIVFYKEDKQELYRCTKYLVKRE